MSSPLISVVIPTFNASKFLREALDSLVAQTFTDWEALCVNDGSTDDSLAIMQEYAAKDNRFRILNGPNGGYGKAMNRGMDAAKGKYMAIFEPDDYLPANAYKTLFTLAEENQLDIAKGNFADFWGDGAKREFQVNNNIVERQLICPRRELLAFCFSSFTWTCLYRMDFLRKHGIRHHETPGASFQDNGWFILTFSYADRLMCTRELVYYYRNDNPASSVRNFKDDSKMHAMRDEYAFSRRHLEQTPQIWQLVQPAWVWRRMVMHDFTLMRLLPEHQLIYLEDFREELKTMKGMDFSMVEDHRMQKLQLIVRSPEEFLQAENATLPHKPRSISFKRRLMNLFLRWGRGYICVYFLGLKICSYEKQKGIYIFSLFGKPLLQRHVYVNLVHPH